MCTKRQILIGVAAAVLFCSAPPPAAGQGLTGAINGTVKDQTGGVLPGVSITIESPSLIGGSQTRVTEGDGTYRFPVLPPGTYTLTFELAGFQRIERRGIIVQPDRTATVDQTLNPAAVAEQVTVTGEAPMVDVRSTQVASTVSAAVLEGVPVPRRFTDVLNIMPGVQNGLYTFSPVNAVYGSKVTDNVYSVDGVNFVDPNVSSAVTDIPYDDIQEVQVSTSGQSSEFGSASGGVFNFITKSGGNSFKGLLSGYLQNKDLTSNNITDELAAQGIRPSLFDFVHDWGGNLGGPIKKDRLWFFGSYYNLEQEQSYSDFPVPIPTTQWQSTVKADGQLNSKNRFGFYYNYRDRSLLPFNFGFRTAADPRTWIGIGWHNHLTGANWTSTPNSNTVIQVRTGIALFDLINREPNVVPGTPVYLEQANGVISGGPMEAAGLAQRDRYEIKGDISRFFTALGGQHDIKGGYSWETLPLDIERRDQAHGNYLRHLTLNGQPFRVQLLGGPGHALTTIGHNAAFVQDQWAIGSRLTLNLGLRYDRWTASLGPDTWEGGPWFPPEDTPEQKGIVTLAHISPRLGVVWDPTGTRKWAIKGAYGRFYQRVDGTTVGFARFNRQGTLTYDWIDRNGDRVYQRGEEGTVRGDSRPLTAGVFDPDLKMPYTDSFNVGVEVELAAGFGLAVNGVFKRERDLWSRIDVNKPFDTAYDAVTVINPLDSSTMTVYSIKPAFQALPQQQLLTNPTSPVKLFRDYNGLEFVVKRRMQNNWTMQASYNLGRNNGSVGTLFFDHQRSPYLDPNVLINVEGDQQLDRRHMVKATALYEFPYGIQLSGQFQYLSGLPLFTSRSGGTGVTGAYYVRFTRQQYPAIQTSPFIEVPGEPQGSRRLNGETTLDLRLQKRTRIRGNVSVDALVDVFNTFNANTITRVQTLSQVLPNFLRPAEIMQPRAARLGVRVNF